MSQIVPGEPLAPRRMEYNADAEDVELCDRQECTERRDTLRQLLQINTQLLQRKDMLEKKVQTAKSTLQLLNKGCKVQEEQNDGWKAEIKDKETQIQTWKDEIQDMQKLCSEQQKHGVFLQHEIQKLNEELFENQNEEENEAQRKREEEEREEEERKHGNSSKFLPQTLSRYYAPTKRERHPNYHHQHNPNNTMSSTGGNHHASLSSSSLPSVFSQEKIDMIKELDQWEKTHL